MDKSTGMDKKKLVCFLAFALVFPITYLSIRFNLFSSSKNISLWGLIVVALFLGVVGVLIKYYLDGMKTKYSMVKQLLQGFVKIILPLIIVLACTVFIYLKSEWIIENMKLFIEALCVIIGCEAVAIVINPLPKWAFENNVEGIVAITDKIFHRGEDINAETPEGKGE